MNGAFGATYVVVAAIAKIKCFWYENQILSEFSTSHATQLKSLRMTLLPFTLLGSKWDPIK